MPSFIQTRGAELAEDGYLVCAIRPGAKIPIDTAWGENPLSPEQCRRYPHEAGVGIICGKGDNPVYGIDVDVPGDVEFSDDFRLNVIQKKYGDVSYRVGMPPKFLVPMRGPAGIGKKQSRWFVKNGVKARIEILACGQQFVAAHVHPDTGKPYRWLNDSPFDFGDLSRPEELPEVDEAGMNELVAKFEEMAQAHGWEAKSPKESSASLVGDAALAAVLTQRRLGVTIKEIEPYVMAVDIDSRDTWLRVGMALNFEYAGTPSEDAAIELWDRASRDKDGYRGRDSLEYIWLSFGKRVGPSVTLGWVKFVSKYSDRITQLNDLGLAYRLQKQYGGRLLYVPESKTWVGWDGFHWRHLEEGAANGYVFNMCDGILLDEIKDCTDDDRREALRKVYYKTASYTAACNVRAAAQSIPEFCSSAALFDANARYIGCLNGDIDLFTGELLPPDPSRMISKSCGIAYDPNAKCPLWERTVRETRSNAEFADEEVDYIQRVFGYAALGNPKDEVMFIWHGNGCNGKSTILNTARRVFGEYAQTVNADTLTATSTGGGNANAARDDIVDLQGCRLAIANETDQRSRLREATVKSLVSTDAIKARRNYEGNRVFHPTWGLIMATNYVPNVYGNDDGIWRRIQMLSFERNFNTDKSIAKDINRAEKLMKELPGILAWVVRGAQKYLKDGLKQPKSSVSETSEFRKAQDYVGDWFAERCERDPEATVESIAAWNSFDQWSRGYGYDRAVGNAQALSRRIYKLGNIKSVWVNGKRGYRGFRLKDSILS